MASISSLGIGSGMDIGSLVSQLVSAEGQGKIGRLDRKETILQAQLSAFGAFKSTLSEFRSTLLPLNLSSTYNTVQATSGHPDLYSVSATSLAAKGNHSIEVVELAQAHRVSTKAADAVASVDDVIGTGTLTFEFGEYAAAGADVTFTPDATKTKTVTITDGSLAGIRDAINDANIGVEAAIVNDGSGYRLVMTSETGAANAMRISTADDDANDTDAAGLSLLAYSEEITGGIPATANLEQTVDGSARDATVRIDGITITSASNTVSGAIDNVTIDLKKAELGTVSTLSISNDTSGIVGAVQAFVDGFNVMAEAMKGLTYYNADNEDAGLLIGDATLRGVDYSVRRVLGEAVASFDTKYNALSTIGISTNRDGTLSLDTSKLQSALSEDLDGVKALFAGGEEADPVYENVYSYNGFAGAGINASLLNVSLTQEPTQATYTGNKALISFPTTAVTGNYTFDLTVDGVTQSISLTPGTYRSGEILALQLQRDIDAAFGGNVAQVSFDEDAGTFSFKNNVWGSAGSISMSNANSSAKAVLGFADGSDTGLDIVGTIHGEAATGVGNVLTGNGGTTYAGMTVTFEGKRLQSSVDKVDTGIIDKLTTLMDGYLGANGLINSRTSSLSDQIEDIGVQRETLGRHLSAYEDRLVKQFSAMDGLVAQLNSTSTYLQGQFAQLANLNKKQG